MDYRRMGNVKQHLGNATSTTSLHYLWRNPRGTVLRIQALALVAIVLSFFLVVYGSSRRWSNRWIVQKGFLAAQVLSLSLGTYSIGLMQSSSVKSEMYPIWAVSLLTLFGCMDPVTSYNSHDYKSPLLKVIFQLCLYCGYVVLMCVSSVSGVVGNLAVCVLSAITFIKSFHRSLALVLPSRKRSQLEQLESREPEALEHHGNGLEVHLPLHPSEIDRYARQPKRDKNMGNIYTRIQEKQFQDRLKVSADDKTIIEHVCLGYSLSHLLQRRFLGLHTDREMEYKRDQLFKLFWIHPNIDYKRTLKAIEVELAFLYEIFFTSNEFIHYYEAKTSSFWALASFIGICFVGVATAIPGTLTRSHRHSTSTGPNAAGTSIIVGTTTADLIVTLVILVSLALLQLLQLLRCWTSNWARVAFACEYAVGAPMKSVSGEYLVRPRWWWWPWMRLKAFVVTRMNWFDNKHLWQDKLGQYSLVAEIQGRDHESCRECLRIVQSPCHSRMCGRMAGMLGLQYIGQVLRELWGSDAKGGAAVRLDEDVKASIADFLGQMKSTRIGKEWCSLFVDNGVSKSELPFRKGGLLDHRFIMSQAYSFTESVMVWHIATWYCEHKEKPQPKEEEGTGCSETAKAGGGRELAREEHRHVAIALSKYCAYLVVSAPELLPGSSAETKRAFDQAIEKARKGLAAGEWTSVDHHAAFVGNLTNDAFLYGVYFGKLLCDETPPPSYCTRRRSDDPWEVLARLWVQTLLYAAPYGDVEAHRQRLSQGGEFITHLWSLLYHLGFDKWEHDKEEETKKEGSKDSSSIQQAPLLNLLPYVDGGS
ncbi:unnamed protein product [Urochloa decumbens]|uniref:DUF4220 domain-containing protein n=1 Tax=Urochloa decumbens TaxID=240449 RepID=A0ABC9GDH7_9POAL